MVPGKPDSPVATVLNATAIEIKWRAPAFDGHSAILSYVLQYRDFVGGVWYSSARQVNFEVTSGIFDHLKPFTSYEFQIRATNKIGPGSYSDPSTPVTTVQTGILNLFY